MAIYIKNLLRINIMIYKIKALLTTDPSITYIDSEGNTKPYHYLEGINVNFAISAKTKEEVIPMFVYLLKETLNSLEKAKLPFTNILCNNNIQILNKFDDGVTEINFELDLEREYGKG